MEVIVFEKEAFYKLLGEMKRLVKEAVKDAQSEQQAMPSDQVKWVDRIEAESILKCKKDKLKQLRDDDEIKTSKGGRNILYDKQSLYDYLERNSSR